MTWEANKPLVHIIHTTQNTEYLVLWQLAPSERVPLRYGKWVEPRPPVREKFLLFQIFDRSQNMVRKNTRNGRGATARYFGRSFCFYPRVQTDHKCCASISVRRLESLCHIQEGL